MRPFSCRLDGVGNKDGPSGRKPDAPDSELTDAVDTELALLKAEIRAESSRTEIAGGGSDPAVGSAGGAGASCSPAVNVIPDG